MTHDMFRVLMSFHPLGNPVDWGAWVGACIEILQDDGYLTKGLTTRLTDKGLEYINENFSRFGYTLRA